MVQIPAVCYTCETVFPSGFEIGRGSSTFVGNVSGPCPNGHPFGYIPDGVYTVADGLLRIARGEYGHPDDLKKMLALARSAAAKPSTQPEILSEIAAFFPAEYKHAFRNMASGNPTLIIATLIALLGWMIIATAGGIAMDAVKSNVLSTYENHSTEISPIAREADDGSKLTRPERRRIEKAQKKEAAKRKKQGARRRPTLDI